MIEIYADGACSGNPGPGGWGTIIIRGGNREEIKGSSESTTNNRMEMTAVIEGLKRTAEGSDVTIRSDSQYLISTMTRGWKRSANLDLWHVLDDLTAKRKVHWVWVKGHDGHPENERAHRLATEAVMDVVPRPSHFDASSGKVRMVDVSEKPVTERAATARGTVKMQPATLELIEKGQAVKGDVLAIAQTAGILGAKKTANLIPLCHPLHITHISVEFALHKETGTIEITATVKADEKTGVEMEALTAVAVSALTIYDMCKAVDRGMRIESIRLARKSGGRSGTIELEDSTEEPSGS